jgi:hypothetical protein
MSDQSTETVRYLPVPGFPNYRVGDDGSVWSRFRGPWKRMKTPVNKRGRPYVHLSRGDRGKHRWDVCRLVLWAFVGPCPPGMECCHFPDRNPANNQLGNLRWDTHLANMRDMAISGNRRKREVLTEEQTMEAIRLLESGVKRRRIARIVGCKHSTLHDALKGRRYHPSQHGESPAIPSAYDEWIKKRIADAIAKREGKERMNAVINECLPIMQKLSALEAKQASGVLHRKLQWLAR